jgi:SAM-dependent methyltransferase
MLFPSAESTITSVRSVCVWGRAGRNPLITRSIQEELLEQLELSEDVVSRVYRQLTRIHSWLGDTRAVVGALQRDPLPIRRVMDIGCGHGGVLSEVRRKLAVDVVGVDIRAGNSTYWRVPIRIADAVRDPLPEADVAFSMYLGHHLSDQDLARLIMNVGRYCRRFILLDLVRHRLPLNLFRAFVSPFVSDIIAQDGRTSIARSYTPAELRQITARALDGTGSEFSHSVAPLQIRQIVDIAYAPGAVNARGRTGAKSAV